MSLPPFSSRKCVLVVDDDASVREMLVRVLTESGYRTIAASDGQSAVALLTATARVDLALVDLGMPGENGWTTLAAMRRHDPKLAAIIITAWPHQQTAAKAVGATACFEKPLDFPELLAAIANVLKGDVTARELPASSTAARAPSTASLS